MSLRRLLSRRSLCLAFLAAALPAHAVEYQRGYLVDSVSLPTSQSQANTYAIDLDGDGGNDNNFGSMLAAFDSSGFAVADAMNAAIASGSIIHLLSLHSTDPLFANDPAAQTDWYVGLPAPAPPKFDGTDNLPYDNNYAPGVFLAALANGGFTSEDPATTTTPVSLTFKLQIGPDQVSLFLQGTRLSFTTDHAGHLFGQINGSIQHDDFPTKIAPAYADLCNSAINADPNSGTATNCKGLFDQGGSDCGGNSNSFAGDGLIEVCEITSSALMQSLWAPDVYINPDGHYVLTPGPTTILANSLGLRFTAIASPDRVFANGFDPP